MKPRQLRIPPQSRTLRSMRTPILILLIASTAGLLAVLLAPRPAGACQPCQRVESGELWHLEVESWTVDDVAQPVPSVDGGLYVSNPIRRDMYGSDDGWPDYQLEASTIDPRTPGELRILHLEVVR